MKNSEYFKLLQEFVKEIVFVTFQSVKLLFFFFFPKMFLRHVADEKARILLFTLQSPLENLLHAKIKRN